VLEEGCLIEGEPAVDTTSGQKGKCHHGSQAKPATPEKKILAFRVF
jgi:hypothetical protein